MQVKQVKAYELKKGDIFTYATDKRRKYQMLEDAKVLTQSRLAIKYENPLQEISTQVAPHTKMFLLKRGA